MKIKDPFDHSLAIMPSFLPTSIQMVASKTTPNGIFQCSNNYGRGLIPRAGAAGVPQSSVSQAVYDENKGDDQIEETGETLNPRSCSDALLLVDHDEKRQAIGEGAKAKDEAEYILKAKPLKESDRLRDAKTIQN